MSGEWSCVEVLFCEEALPPPLPSSLDTHWPRTCCSRLSITLTACCSTINLVCGFSWLRWSWHMRPSSLKASLMSRTRSRSRVLFAILLTFSRSALISTGRSSSSSSSSRLAKSQRGGNETTVWVQFTDYSFQIMVCAINFPNNVCTTRKGIKAQSNSMTITNTATRGGSHSLDHIVPGIMEPQEKDQELKVSIKSEEPWIQDKKVRALCEMQCLHYSTAQELTFVLGSCGRHAGKESREHKQK